MSKNDIGAALSSHTMSLTKQRAILLQFIESKGLTQALAEHLAGFEPEEVLENTNERFYHDVDCLVSELHEFCNQRAKKIVLNGAVDPKEHYGSDGRQDFTLAKTFVCAMGSEITFQYRPLNKTKASDALLKKIQFAI